MTKMRLFTLVKMLSFVYIYQKHIDSMNKTIGIMVGMLGGVVGATEAPQAEPVYPEQITMQTYNDERSVHQLAVNVGGGISTEGEKELYDTNMILFDVEYAYYLNNYNALTIGLTIGSGGDDVEQWLPGRHHPHYFAYEYDRSTFALMVGYRLQLPVTERLSFALGVKAGLDFQTLALDYYPQDFRYDPYDDEYYSEPEQEENDLGFKYAAYAGLNYQLTDHTSLEIGYQFSNSTAQPAVHHEWERHCPKVTAPKYGLHEIRAGLRFDF